MKLRVRFFVILLKIYAKLIQRCLVKFCKNERKRLEILNRSNERHEIVIDDIGLYYLTKSECRKFEAEEGAYYEKQKRD